jgi:hypothetical protein
MMGAHVVESPIALPLVFAVLLLNRRLTDDSPFKPRHVGDLRGLPPADVLWLIAARCASSQFRVLLLKT